MHHMISLFFIFSSPAVPFASSSQQQQHNRSSRSRAIFPLTMATTDCNNSNNSNIAPNLNVDHYKARYGSWALVTGASSGIGAAFARRLASKGMNLVTVARRKDMLHTLCDVLQSEYGIETVMIQADLGTDEGIDAVAAQTEPYDIGLLVNNAGCGCLSRFEEIDQRQVQSMINVNILGLTKLSHIFITRALGRTCGKKFGILFISSMSSNGVPYLSVYSSTKAYVTCLAYTLAEEYPQFDMLSVEPGFVKSEMTLGEGEKGDASKYGRGLIDADTCVDLTLQRFQQDGGRGRVFTPGLINQFYKNLMLWLPRRWAVYIWAKVIRPSLSSLKSN